MSSVDTRVVEMRFDNSQFESGIKSSMSSLEKLKASLDLKSSEKSLESLEAAGKKFSLAGIANSIDELNSKFSTMGIVGMTAISNLTNSAINSLRGITSSVTGLIKTGGINRALNIESAKFQLEGLGVAWDSISEDINYGVQDTAYGLDAAAKVASQLVASGVQVGDTMKSDLRAISGVAAMTNSTYEDIGQIFTTIAGNGKLMTEQLRQFSSRGLNVAATLGEQLGKTEAEIRDMVTKGQIDFQTFASAMDSAFGEHAKDANKTFTGALSNMKAAFSRIGADIATPALEMLRVMMNALIPVINAIRSELAPAIESLTIKMKILGYFVQYLLEDFNNLGLSKVVKVIKNIKKALTPTEKTLDKLGRTFDGVIAVLDIFVEIAGSLLTPILESLGFTVGTVGDSVLSITANIGDMLCEFRDWVLENKVVQKTFGTLGKGIATAIKYVGEFVKTVEESGTIDKTFSTISTVFENLFNLISGKAPNVTDVLGDFKDGLLDLVQNFSLDKLIDTFKDLGDAILGVKDNVGDVTKTIQSTGNSFPKLQSSFSGITSGISTFINSLKSMLTFENAAKAVTIALGATSVKLGLSLGKLIDKIINIKDPISALTKGLENLFNTLSASIANIGKSVSRAANAVALKNFAEAILMLVGAIAILALLPDKSRIQDSLITIGLLVVVMSGVMKLMTITPAGTASMASIAAAFIALAAGIAIMGGVIVEMKKIAEGFKSFSDTAQTLLLLVGSGGTLVVLSGLMGVVAKDLSKSVLLLIPVAASLYVFAVGLEKLANVDIGNLGEFMLKLIVFFGYLSTVSKMAESLTGGAAAALIAMSATILIFAEAIKKMADVSWSDVLLSLPGMIECIVFIKIILKALSSMKGEAAKVGATVLAIAAAMDLMVIAIKAFGKMSMADVLEAVAMMTPIMLLFSLVIKSTQYAGENAAKAAVTLVAMAVAIDLLAVAIGLLSLLDAESVAKATVCVSALMYMCSIIIKSTKDISSASKTVAMIAVLIGVLTGCLALLTFTDQDKLITSAASLISVMGMLSLLFLAISKLGSPSKQAMITIGIISLVLIEITALFAVMNGMDGDNMLKMSTSMAIVIASMIAMMAAVVVLGNIGTVSASALPGIAIISGVIAAIGLVLTGIGELLNSTGASEAVLKDLDLMVEVMTKIGECIGALVGGVLGGIALGATSGLEKVGQNLSAFAVAIQPFLLTTNMIDTSKVEGVKSLVEVVTTLAEAKIFNSIGNLFGGSTSDLKTTFSDIGEAISAFSEKVKDVDPSNLEDASTAAKYLAKIITVIPKTGGLSGFIFGNTMDMETFSEGLESYGEALASFSNAVSGEDFDIDAIKSAAKASLSLTDLVNELPETGGKVQWFFGSYDLGLFGEQLGKYAEDLVDISNTFKTGEFSESSCALIQAAADATEPLFEMVGNLDPTGGEIQKLTGTKNIALFGENLETYAESLVAISTKLNEDGGVDYDAIENARECTSTLIELCNELNPTGGLSSFFSGEQDFSKFGSNLEDYGESLKNFGIKIADVDMAKLQSGVTQSRSLVTMLKDVSNNAGSLTDGEAYFSSSLIDFGIAIQTYYESIKDVDENKVAKIVSSCNLLISIGSKLGSIDTSKWIEFGGSLKSFGGKFEEFYESVKGIDTLKIGTLSTAFKDLAALTNSLKSISGVSFKNVSEAFNEVGKVSITQMNAQFVTGKTTVVNSINKVMESSISAIRSRRSDMAQSATYVCMGFINGVNANSAGIQNAGTSIGKKFLNAMNSALDINSPSKETEQSGIYTVAGFVKGVASGEDDIIDVSTDIANSASSSFSSESIKGAKGVVSSIKDYFTDKANKAKDTVAKEITNSVTSTATSAVSSATSATTSAISSATTTTTKAATTSVKKTTTETKKTVKKYYKEVGKEILRALDYGATSGKYLTSSKASSEQLIAIGKNIAKQVQTALKNSTGIFDDYWEALNESEEKTTTKTTATLNEAANAYTKFKDSVKESLESVMDGFKEFEASTDSLTTKDVIKNLQSQISATNNYTKLIKGLKAMGYSNKVIKTITDMGVADGTVYAKALISASTKQVKTINSTVAKESKVSEKSADVIAAVFVDAEKASKSVKKTVKKNTKSTSNSIKNSSVKSSKAIKNLSEEAIEKFREMAKEAGLSNDLIETYIKTSAEYVNNVVTNTERSELLQLAEKEQESVQAIYNSMSYGSEAAKYYADNLNSANDTTVTSTETATAAKKAIRAYARSLYYNTDAGKENKATLDELNATLKQQKTDLSDLREERDKYKNTDKDKYNDLNDQVKAQKVLIRETKKNIQEAKNEIYNGVAENWNSLTTTITENFKSAISALSVSYDTGINPFEEYTEDTETSMETMLSNFQSQLNAYSDYRNNLLKLYQMKENGQITQATYDYIKDLGRDGENYLNAVVNATSTELTQLDSLLSQNTEATSETLLQNAKEKAANIVKYQNLLIDLANRGFDANTLYELLESGFSDDNLALAEAYSNMSDTEIQSWNDIQTTGTQAAEEAAEKILAAFAGETEKTGSVIESVLSGDAGAMTTAIAKVVSEAVDDALETVSTETETESEATGKNVVVGIANGISKNTSTVTRKAEKTSSKTNSAISTDLSKSSGWTIGSQMCAGLALGISDNTSTVVDAAAAMAAAARAASESVLSIESPSKVYAQIGKYCVEGMANGINNNISKVEDAGENIGTSTLSATKEIATQIQDILESDFNISPTITPVLDLSTVKSGANQLSSLLSRNSAIAASTEISNARDNKDSSDSNKNVTVNNNYDMTQNNYSPKSLSRKDIYRRTKNMFSSLKGATNYDPITYSY